MSCKHKHTSRALDKELDSMMRGGSESSGLKVPPARNKSSSSSSSSSSPYRTPDQRVVPSTTTRPSSGHKSHYARILTPTKTSSVIGGHSKRLSITTKSSAPSTPISNTGSNGIARSGGRKVEPILSPSQRIAKNVITRTPAPTERYEEYQTFTSLTVPPAPSSIVSNPLVDITLYNSSPHSNFVAEATHVPLQAQEPQPTGRVLFVSPREKENMINTSLQADPGPEQASSLARLATRLDTTAPRLLKALRDVDRDKDGLLSYNDFKRGVTSANLNVTSADLDLVVKDLDSQQAGVVDYVEFVRSVNDAKQTQLQSSGPGPGPAEKAGSRFLVSPTPDCFLNGYERGVRQVLRGKQDYALFPKDAHGKNVALSASDRLLRSPFGVSCKADADMYNSPMAADALCATNRAQSDVSARKGAAAAATTASVPAQESIDSFSNVFPAAARGQAEGPFSFARSTSGMYVVEIFCTSGAEERNVIIVAPYCFGCCVDLISHVFVVFLYLLFFFPVSFFLFSLLG